MSFSFSPGGFHRPHVHMHHLQDTEGKIVDLQVTRKLLRYLLPYRREMVESLALMLAGSALTLLAPYLIKRMIDENIATGNTVALRSTALAILGTYALTFLLNWRRRLVLGRVGNEILRTMRNQVFRHYQVLSMGYYDRHNVGSLISRVLSDVGVIHELLSQGIINMISDVVILVATVVVMLLINARLALMTLSVLPVILVSTLLFAKKARVVYRRTRERVSELTGRLAEDLGAMRVIQAFSEEDRMTQQFKQVNRANRDAHMAAVRLGASFTPLLEVLSISATAIILWFGGQAVMAGALTVGTMVAFLTYTSRLFQPVLDLGMVFNTWQAAMAGGERILGILAVEPEIQDAPGAVGLSQTRGDIVFQNVDFSYNDGTPVLCEVSFHIAPGETTALVGPTGAGKSTVAKLLSRFYEIDEGSIFIDGLDIRDVQVKPLREQLGVVPQEPFLFQGSIAYNIAFGKPEASREEIVAAAKAANVHDFISSLPQGYDTEIQESSTNVSLGQRQLICLARVILADPRILILDEATSSVDLRTEGLIQDTLERLMSGRTSLVIAHRLATIERANMILVIDEGRIAERGTHEALLKEGGLYAQLYQTQFLSAETEPA